MFCPKCGTENPDDGKFCRKCGTDLELVSDVITGKITADGYHKNRKKKKDITWEGALTLLFISIAFFVISIILAFSVIGQYWWFWMLVPAFATLASGVAQVIQLRRDQENDIKIGSDENMSFPAAEEVNTLPSGQTEFVSSGIDMKHRTGDLAPPSVVEGTTRRLEMDPDGRTMKMPKTDE